MIEENFSIPKRVGGIAYDPLPDDKYTVELFDIKDSLSKYPTFNTKDLPKEQQEFETVLSFQFVVLDAGANRGRCLWANFVPAVLYISQKKGKNALYKILEAIAGKELTPEQEAKISPAFINSLVGRQLCVFTATKAVGDKKYNNIVNFTPCANKLAPLTAEEKEKAVVKVRAEQEAEHTEAQQVAPDNSDPTDEEIRIEDVPF
jgi:hypothetical protein